MNAGTVSPVVGSIVIDHGLRGLFVRFVGWWFLILIGLIAVSLLPMSVASFAKRGELDWSSTSDALAWFGIGLGVLFIGSQLFRARRSFAAVYVVDDMGIIIKSRDQIDLRVPWQEITSACIDPILTQIRFTAASHHRPIVLINGAASYARFKVLRAIVETRAGSVTTVVRPSWAIRVGAMVCGLAVVPMAVSKLAMGYWGGAAMLGVGAFGIYFGITGMSRLYRSPTTVHGCPRS